MNPEKQRRIRQTLRSLAEAHATTIKLMEQALDLMSAEISLDPVTFWKSRGSPEVSRFTSKSALIDRETLTITYRGRSCFLGRTLPFRLFDRLACRPNVSQASGRNGDARYDLVCGHGRLEAFIELGQSEIPAIVVEGTKEDLLLMGLAENLARRQHTSAELVCEISALKERGYSHQEIARKTDLDVTYVKGVLQLMSKGEERLLQAVKKGQLPLYIAITIATSDDKSVQRALQEAYERNDLRGKSLIQARRLIESRRLKGKKSRSGGHQPSAPPVSTEELLKTFQNETLKQKMTIQKAKICETRLLFAVSALKQLFQEDHFRTLLRAERLDTLPQYLAAHLGGSA